jgi:hypothetical protein
MSSCTWQRRSRKIYQAVERDECEQVEHDFEMQ